MTSRAVGGGFVQGFPSNELTTDAGNLAEYLSEVLPRESWGPLGREDILPGLKIMHESGIAVEVVSFTDHVIETCVVGIPQEKDLVPFAPPEGTKLVFQPTKHGSIWSCKNANIQVPLSLCNSPFDHGLHLITVAYHAA